MNKAKKDKFDVTDGNLEVLTTVIEMMTIPEWRFELRKLVFDYKTSKTLFKKEESKMNR